MASSKYKYLPLAEKEPDFRIALVGKTGVGKSAAGNTILGKKAFISEPSLSSVTSLCEKETSEFGGLNLAVIDTPGLFDTEQSNEAVMKEIAKSISMAAPGPHVFLIVIQPTRFTPEEQKSVEIIKTMFGEEAERFTMVLFTQGDLLKKANKRIEDMLEKSQPLKDIISQCSSLQRSEDKYHVFDNEVEDPAQVRGLVEKIRRMVQRNGGRCYTNQMFRAAERANQEEKVRLLRENPGMNQQEARRQAERDNSFIRDVLWAVATGGVVGIATGAGVGARLGFLAGGPLGAVVGAAVGVSVGGVAGAVVLAAAAIKKKGACVIQ